MILVTVGTHTAPFDRLVVAADEYAASTTEEVVIQRGASRYVSRRARSFDFCSSSELASLMERSRVVVCQAADTVLEALRLGRPVVAVPRMRRYSEVINDHQVDFARALASRGWVHVANEQIDLAAAIEAAVALRPSMPEPEPEVARAIRRQLLQWLSRA